MNETATLTNQRKMPRWFKPIKPHDERDPVPVYLSKALVATLLLIATGFFVLARFEVSIDPQHFAGLPTSLPWYAWVTDRQDMQFGYGDYIAFNTDERMEPYFNVGANFVKKVVGMPGDRVMVHNGIVKINGDIVATINIADILKKPVSSFNRTLTIPPHHFWVLGTNPVSFDSRYWGLVSRKQIIGESWPVWPLF